MKTFRLGIAAAAAVTLLLALQPARADLAADPGFGTGGLAGVNFAASVDSARAVAVQADGRLVLVGLSRQVLANAVYSYVGVARVLANGAPDPDFGTAGQVSLLPGGTPAEPLAGGDGRAVLVQPDHKILVAGAWSPGGGVAGQIFVLRLDAGGALDPEFGTGGIVLLTVPGLIDPVADGLALQSDGSIIVVGSGDAVAGIAGFVLRLTPGGILDGSFGDAGVLAIPNPVLNGLEFGLRDVAVLAGDELLVAGGGSDVYVARLTADGAFDPAFATGGSLSVDLETLLTGGGASVDDVFGFAVQSTGRIVLAGVRRRPQAGQSIASLVRVLPNGSVDASFGTNGVLDIPSLAGQGAALDVVALADDALVTAGSGIPFVQVSANGRAQFPLSVIAGGDFLVGLQALPGGRVAGAGSRRVLGSDTEFLAAVVTASPLADVVDTTPDPFFFDDVPGTVARGSTQTSNTVTITGIRTPSPVSIQGGVYSIDGGGFTADPGVIQNNQTVTVRHVASAVGNTATDTTLTIGGVSDTFTSVTAAGSVAPFSLGSRTGVQLWVFQQSDTITIQGAGGATGPFDISVSGGEGVGYSVGCTGLFTAQPGQVANGTTVCVRHISSTAGNTPVVSTLVVGGTAGEFTTTTVDVDSTPDAFAFAPQADVPLLTVVQSAPVTITGIGSGVQALVRVSGGEYSIGCTGTFTVGLGQIRNGQTLCVRHTSAGTSRGQVTTTVLVADVVGTFTSTTVEADLLPDRFEFASLSGVEPVATVTSAPVVITGITGPAEVAVSGSAGDQYSVGCTDTFTATPGRISNGQTLCVRHTSSGTGEGTVTSEVRVGGRVATFSSTTRVADLVPDEFSIAPVTNAGLSRLVTSAPVTITGIDGPATIAATGGAEYSVGCGDTFTTALGTIRNGQTVCVRGRSAAADGESVTYLLGVGPASAFTSGNTDFAKPFVITTGDTTPDPFSFTDLPGVRQATLVTSAPVTITGITAPSLISIDIGDYSIGCRGNWTRADGTVTNGDTVCVRHTSAPLLDTPVNSVLTVGGRWQCAPPTVLEQLEGRAVCVNALGVPVAGARTRVGGAVSDTFTSTTSTETVPGSSAVDAWTLALLAPLAWLRRRRRAVSAPLSAAAGPSVRS